MKSSPHRSLLRWLLLSLLCLAPWAHAQTLEHIFSNPRVVTSDRDPTFYVLKFDWNGLGAWAVPAPVITRTNNVITITHTITRFYDDGLGPGWVSFSLGRFPPGTYTVTYQADEYFTGIGTYEPLVTQFTVGATPTAVPTLTQLGAALLVLGLLLITHKRMRA